jgi:ATP-dependent DNA helicase MPH1
MSSDDYYDTDPDEAVLGELDAIEAAQASSSTCHNKRPALPKEDSFFDDSFDFDERELENLDKAIEEAYQSQPVHRPVPPKVSSRGSLQTTLFGDVIPAETSSNARTFSRTASKGQSKPPQETKKWDHTEFAKSGWKKPKAKAKARVEDAEEDIEDEAPEFEQFPAPFISGTPPSPLGDSYTHEYFSSWVRLRFYFVHITI